MNKVLHYLISNQSERLKPELLKPKMTGSKLNLGIIWKINKGRQDFHLTCWQQYNYQTDVHKSSQQHSAHIHRSKAAQSSASSSRIKGSGSKFSNAS